MKVLLAGGGTGGHIYPAVTIARGLQAKVPNCEILFVGTRHGLEADIIPKEGFPFRTIEVQGMQRKLGWDTIRTIGKLFKGLAQSCRILRAFQPDVVVGTGGYVCGPVVLMASFLGIPTVIQEQNVIPGITNKLLSRFVKLVLLGFADAARYFPGKANIASPGNPVRPDVIDACRDNGLRAFALDPKKRTILVAGGSRGARTINEAMLQVYRDLANETNVQILHVTGNNEYEAVKAKAKQAGIDWQKHGNIILVPYLYNMSDAMAAADLIVYRAGAVGLAEITVRGLPAVLIPYPYAAENHQEYNARLVEQQGAAVVITDKELTGELLSQTIRRLLAEPEKLTQMAVASQAMGRPHATENIVEAILALLK